MKSSILMVCIAVVALMSTGCTRVEPGYVGLVVNMWGENRGVEDVTIETGRVIYNPVTEDIYVFPIFTQNASWKEDGTEDNESNQSITFNSLEGAVINADVAVSYQMKPEAIASIFVELRQDADYIREVYVKGKVADALSVQASKIPAVDIFGAQKQTLLDNVRKHLEETMPGFKFDMISFVGALRVDELVKQSINLTIQATQKAIEAENKIKQSEAEAKQKVADAEGRAQSVLIEAKSQAEANQILTESLSPELIQYEALQKWNGELPKVTGEVVPFITMDSVAR